MHTVMVNRRAAARLERGHPWVFRSDLEGVPDVPPGSVVRVQLARGKPLGTAHYSSTSQIALRMLAERDAVIDEGFLRERLSAAIALRQRVVRDSDSYRVVYGEADFSPVWLSTVTATLAIQTLSQGMDALQPLIVNLLGELLHPRAVVEKNRCKRALEGLPLRSGVGGRARRADHHLAQRPALRGGFARGKRRILPRSAGRTTPRFDASDRAEPSIASRTEAASALHLASVCESVEAIDSSAHGGRPRAKGNAEENGLGNVSVKEADVFQLLASYQAARRSFETIVLDPPAFTKSRSRKEDAGRGYREINRRA